MTNPSTPYGFTSVGLIDGSAPTGGIYKRGAVNPASSSKIFQGDVVAPLSGGFFAAQAPTGGGAPVGGIAVGDFSWTSLTARMQIWQNWWTGNTADVPSGGGVSIGVNANQQEVFKVRSAGTSSAAVNATQVGSNANFVAGSGGNTANGLSSYALDDANIGSGASLPFKIYGLVPAPESDPTSIYNEVFVIFNSLTSP